MMTRMRMRMGTLDDRGRGFAARAVTRAARENGGDDTVRSTRGVDARSGARDEANDDEFARGTDSATRLSPEDARAELERLDAELAMHDERYYNDAMPTIDDAEYDGLRARYEAIERAHA